MNAVKNCLVVLAAAVALASCSADPTSSLAGKNPTISATPGAVALQAGQTQEVFVSAVDQLGGAVDGKFSVTNPDATKFTAAIDTSYVPVTGGDRPATRTRIVVTALKESDGSFTVTGTGGTITIPVRIAPDTLASSAIIFNNGSLAVGQYDTATAPAGLQFTSGTTLDFMGSNGLFTPVVSGFSADFKQVYFIPAPGSHGRIKVNGMANISTPNNTFFGISADSVTVASLPNFPATHSAATFNANVVDTITAGAGWNFTSASVATSNGFDAIPLGMSADSTKLYVLPTPGTSGAVTVSGLAYAPYPAPIVLTVPTSTTITVGPTPDLGQDGPTGTIPTIQLPATGAYGFWDLGTFDSTDYSPDGGAGAQYYRYNLGVSAHVNTQVNWNVGNDVDIILLADDGTYSTPLDAFSGASAKAFEVSKSASALAVGTYLLDVINYGPFDSGGSSSVGATIRYQITVF